MAEEEAFYGDMGKFKIRANQPSHDNPEMAIPEAEESPSAAEMRQEVERLISVIRESLNAKEPTPQKLDEAVAKLTLMEFRIADFMPMIHADQSSEEIADLLMKWRRAQGRLN